jgi:hypothetical protein
VQQTLDALRRAQVDVLLLTEDLDASQSAWFGHEPTSVGTTREELEGVDGENAQEAPLEDVLMRAALGTGAEIRWVTAGIEQSPRQGVGAILRYTLPNTAR